MNLPEFSIRRPITVMMTTLAVILFGLVALFRLPVELYPNTSFGEISIVIYVRGGIPPVEVEQMVTKPIEEAVSTVSNLQQLLSVSKEGESTVVLSFKPGTDMDFAALEVREKFAKVKNKLPREIEKPIIAQFKQTDVPCMILSVTSDVRTTEEIRKTVDQTLKENLKRVTGVANVDVAGGRERKILVEVDQKKLRSYGFPMDRVTAALYLNNLNLLSGEVERARDKFLVRVIGEFESIEQLKNIGLWINENGSIIRLKDVAEVKDSYLDPSGYARFNVQPVVSIYIQKESTRNTIRVVNDVQKALQAAQQELPKDLRVIVTSNQAEFIQKAIKNLEDSLLKGVILIFLIFFIFLYRLDWRLLIGVGLLMILVLSAKPQYLYLPFAALLITMVVRPNLRPILVVTLSIPVSVIATFVFMQFMNLTINVITLFGLALGVGILVDNSIVVFENILKKREHGMNLVESAIGGSQEMLLVIVASTVSHVIVFLPMVFVGKEIQLLYAGMAWTIVFSLLISLLAALTLVPMMSSRPHLSQLKSGDEEQTKVRWIQSFYRKERQFLLRMIRYRRYVLIVAAVSVLIALFLLSRLSVEYLGSTEQNKFTTFIEMPTGTKLEVTDQMVKRVEKLISSVPEVKQFSSRVEPWSSKIYVELVSLTKRKRSVSDVLDSLRSEVAKMRPAFIYFQEEEEVGTKEIIADVFGYDYDTLRQLAVAISSRVSRVKGLSDVKIRMREGRPEMQILVSRQKTASQGLTVSDVANQVHAKMRGLRATMMHLEGNEIETITRLDEKYRRTFRDLHKLSITNQRSEAVELEQVADFKFGLGPSEVWRKDRNRMVQVSANIGKIPLSKAVSMVEKELADLQLPEDYFYRFGGDYPTLVRTNRQLKLVLLLVLVLVYLVLSSLFESLTQPFLIMIAVPLALIGAVAALYLGPKSIGVGALLGMMILAGIVVNHSIILVDRINHFKSEKKWGFIRPAVYANRDRLRPILMTTGTTILGLIPMAMDKTEGANLWAPLAQTVIGGLLTSMILSLMVTPAFYLIFQDAGNGFRNFILKYFPAKTSHN